MRKLPQGDFEEILCNLTLWMSKKEVPETISLIKQNKSIK